MSKRGIVISIAVAAVLLLGFVGYKLIVPGEYVPAEDEIALRIQLDTKEDIGLLVFDYSADGSEQSGGISNADKSLIKHGSELIVVWNRQELASSSDSVELLVQFRIITEYVEPNYENIYSEEITKYIDPVLWEAHFGEAYDITITGDKIGGYEAVLN